MSQGHHITFPGDALPPEAIYESRELLFAAINSCVHYQQVVEDIKWPNVDSAHGTAPLYRAAGCPGMRGPRLAARSGGVVPGRDRPVVAATVERSVIENQGTYPKDGRMSPLGHTGLLRPYD
jgi:hypothetical protein